MRASAKVFYALAILATATLTACGNPPPAYGGDDSSLCSDPNRADSACAKLEITSFTVAGEPTTTSVTFDVQVNGLYNGVKITYWRRDEEYHPGPRSRTFTEAPYTVDGLTSEINPTEYVAFAEALRNDARSYSSRSLAFKLAAVPDPCAGFVVPKTTQCTSGVGFRISPNDRCTWRMEDFIGHVGHECVLIGDCRPRGRSDLYRLYITMTQDISGATLLSCTDHCDSSAGTCGLSTCITESTIYNCSRPGNQYSLACSAANNAGDRITCTFSDAEAENGACIAPDGGYYGCVFLRNDSTAQYWMCAKDAHDFFCVE